MSFFFSGITMIGVFVGSFILFFLRSGSWDDFSSWPILRSVFSLYAAAICSIAWIVILEIIPGLPKRLRSAATRLKYKCQDSWHDFKEGLFTKNPEDLAENIREHMRNFRTFLWISILCFLGALISFAVLQFASDSWYRIPGWLMLVFGAAFLPAFGIFLQARGCLWNISILSNYMSSHEVTMAIIGVFLESGKLPRLLWKKIFPHLLLNV